MLLENVNINLAYDSGIPLLGIYPRALQIYVLTRLTHEGSQQHYYKGYKGKQPKCPSTDDRLNKMWCSRATEQYSAIKTTSTDSCYNLEDPQKRYMLGRSS